MQLPRRDAGESMFALPLTRYPGRCQAASRPDRIFSASETYVTCTGTCGLTVGTNLSSDISPLRSIGSGHSQNYRRSRRPVHNRLNHRGSRRSTNQYYLRWQSNVPIDVYMSRIQCGGNYGCSARSEFSCAFLPIIVAYKTSECCIQIVLVADWLAGSCF